MVMTTAQVPSSGLWEPPEGLVGGTDLREHDLNFFSIQ